MLTSLVCMGQTYEAFRTLPKRPYRLANVPFFRAQTEFGSRLEKKGGKFELLDATTRQFDSSALLDPDAGRFMAEESTEF